MDSRRRNWITVCLTISLSLVCAAPVLADGGQVQFSQIVAPYRVTVFTSPTPLRPGPVDISVLLQRSDTEEVVHDAVIDFELRSVEAQRVVRARATRANSTNRLLQSAALTIPSAGRWHVTARVQEASATDAGFDLTVHEPPNRTLTVFACLMVPVLVVALFALRESLAAGERQKRMLPHIGKCRARKKHLEKMEEP
jgi:hypothetical protein